MFLTYFSQGLLILGEVALGKTYDLKDAETMQHPPDPYSSTKGLGRLTPDPAEFFMQYAHQKMVDRVGGDGDGAGMMCWCLGERQCPVVQKTLSSNTTNSWSTV